MTAEQNRHAIALARATPTPLGSHEKAATCHRGHELRVDAGGTNRCKVCERERRKRRWARTHT